MADEEQGHVRQPGLPCHKPTLVDLDGTGLLPR